LINRRHYLPRLPLTLPSIETNAQRTLTGHYISGTSRGQYSGHRGHPKYQLGYDMAGKPKMPMDANGFQRLVLTEFPILQEDFSEWEGLVHLQVSEFLSFTQAAIED
jgi:hypothetical protein